MTQRSTAVVDFEIGAGQAFKGRRRTVCLATAATVALVAALSSCGSSPTTT